MDDIAKGAKVFVDPSYANTFTLLRGASRMSGLPGASMATEVVSFWNNTVGVMHPELRVKKYAEPVTPGYEKVYGAMVAGDKPSEAHYRSLLTKNYAGTASVQDNINTGVRKMIDADYESDVITYEEYLRRKVVFTKWTKAKEDIGSSLRYDIITRAQAETLLQKYTKDDASERYEYLEKYDNWTDTDADGKNDWRKYAEFAEAVRTGDNLTAVISEYLAADKFAVKTTTLADAIRENFKDEWVELYKTDKAEANKLTARMLDAYIALGYDREKKMHDIYDWLGQ